MFFSLNHSRPGMIRVLQETLQEIHVVLQAPSPIVGSMPKSWKPGNMPKTKTGKTPHFFAGYCTSLVFDYWLLIIYQYGLPIGAIKWYVSGDNICLFISYVKQQNFTDRKQGHFGIHSPILTIIPATSR